MATCGMTGMARMPIKLYGQNLPRGLQQLESLPQLYLVLAHISVVAPAVQLRKGPRASLHWGD